MLSKSAKKASALVSLDRGFRLTPFALILKSSSTTSLSAMFVYDLRLTSVVLTYRNMTSERQLDDAHTIIGVFVGMTYHFRLVCAIGPVVGIGLFGGPGPVVSLTYIQCISIYSLKRS